MAVGQLEYKPRGFFWWSWIPTMPCLAGKPSATAQEVWLIYAWTQVDICYPTLTIKYLSRKIPSSDYFWIPFIRRQNNLLDSSHCYLFLHRPPPKKNPGRFWIRSPKAIRSMLVAFYHKLTTSNKPFFLRSLTNPHPQRQRVPFPWPRHAMPSWCCNSCCRPWDASLVAGTVQSVQPNPANSTKSRSSKFVAKLHPGTTMGEESRSWEPKGTQFRWDDILQCGFGTGCFLAVSCCWDDEGFKDGETHINRDSFHHVQAVWKRDCGPREC